MLYLISSFFKNQKKEKKKKKAEEEEEEEEMSSSMKQCFACNKPSHPLETYIVNINGERFYHKTCFKCEHQEGCSAVRKNFYF